MRELVRELIGEKISRRGFVAGMLTAGYSAAAAQSALQSVEPFIAGVSPASTRTVTGTGAGLMADQMIETGAEYVFVSNGSGLGPLCDALVDRPQLRFIQATQEGQVVAIASGYAMASGKPGFCMYSRVGLPHSTSNMYNAMKDRTPLVILADHADSMREGTDSHEDVDDWMEAVKQYTKWRWVAHQPERIPEWIRHAYKVATLTPGGPTSIRFPRDILYKDNVTAEVFSGDAVNIPMELRPNEQEIERVARLLLDSNAPLFLVGPEVTKMDAEVPLIELAELLGVPVAQARSYHADFPNFHPLHVGELRSRMRYPQNIDLIINFGAKAPFSRHLVGKAAMIHATAEPEALGRETPLAGALVGDLRQIAMALIEAIKSLASAQQIESRAADRRAECTSYTTKYHAAKEIAGRRSSGGPVPWQRMMIEFADQLEKDAVIVEEVGTEMKVLSYFRYQANGGMLKIGRTEGRALGWGVGASAGVKLALPNRQVVSFQGDGGFMFGQTDSLWTLSKYDIPVLTVILNNQTYEETRWSIMGRMGSAGQSNRDYISQMTNPEIQYIKLAEAHGMKGERIEHTDELKPAITRALNTLRDGRPYLLDVRLRTFGLGAENPWQPEFSLAQQRSRNV
jgi:thiamine pyrophosphate-dependent acetolactate synthase large subunit-like protein